VLYWHVHRRKKFEKNLTGFEFAQEGSWQPSLRQAYKELGGFGLVAKNIFQKWRLRRVGQYAARAITQCPARRAMTGPEWAWAALSGSPRSTRDIGFALRLAQTYSALCHFGNYLWQLGSQRLFARPNPKRLADWLEYEARD